MQSRRVGLLGFKTGGLSAGIDGALHVVSNILGKEAAQAMASGLEYKREPESN
jgi:transcriptional regulator GlxA family with amidase domain